MCAAACARRHVRGTWGPERTFGEPWSHAKGSHAQGVGGASTHLPELGDDFDLPQLGRPLQLAQLIEAAKAAHDELLTPDACRHGGQKNRPRQCHHEDAKRAR